MRALYETGGGRRLRPARGARWLARLVAFATCVTLGLWAALGFVGAGPIGIVLLIGYAIRQGVGRRREAGRRRSTGLGVLGAAGVLALWLNMTASVPLGLSLRFAGTALIFVGLYPFVRWTRRHDSPVPLFPAVCGLYVMYFAAPIFLSREFTALRRPVSTAGVSTAAWLALGGVVLLELAYYLVVLRMGRVRAEGWEPRVMTGREPVWGVLGLAGMGVYLIVTSFSVPLPLAQVASLFAGVATLAALELLCRWRVLRLSPPAVLFLFGLLIPARVLAGFGTGLNYQAIAVLVALGLLVATVQRRIPWAAVVLALTLVVVLQPVKFAFRQRLSAQQHRASAVDRASGYIDTTAQFLSGKRDLDTRDQFVLRFGYITTFAYVVERTPQTIPYWGGATYLPLLTKPIPRAFFPGKPQEVTGQTFGHRYALLDPSDRATSYNMPQIVELYANFGATGVLLGMAVLGGLYACAERFCMAVLEPRVGTAGAVFVLAQLVLIESGLSLTLSGVAYSAAFVLVLSRVLRLAARRGDRVARERPDRTRPRLTLGSTWQ